jgi:pSer/pThr/pTyr-binding forkhead associated (FHA) protein/RNA polymerase subunit RPABC4/transcription elongation factor Spt4
VQFDNRQIDIPSGELLVGRAPECHIRLLSPTVSRRHLRMVVVPNALVAYDLDSSNGSWVNGERLNGPVELHDGDWVSVGSQTFSVVVVDPDDQWAVEDDTNLTDITPHEAPLRNDTPPPTPAPSSRKDSSTVGRRETWVPAGASGRPIGPPTVEMNHANLRDTNRVTTGTQICAVCTASFDLDQDACPKCGAEAFSPPRYRTCPGCKNLVTADSDECPKCGKKEPSKLPALPAQEPDRRRDLRLEAYLNALYISSTLTFDAVISNISVGGVFLVAELLDPIGTRADILLSAPELGGAKFSGEVVRVVTTSDSALGIEPGMGLRFSNVGPAATAWLQRCIALLTDKRAQSE